MRRWRCWWTWPGSTTLFLIGDEAYREFVYAGEPLQSFGEFTDAAENVILIDTVSKRFSACGARIGCLISRNRELMAHAMKYAQCRLAVPTLDQLASAALYQVGPEYFAAAVRSISAAVTRWSASSSRFPAWSASVPRAPSI